MNLAMPEEDAVGQTAVRRRIVEVPAPRGTTLTPIALQ